MLYNVVSETLSFGTRKQVETVYQITVCYLDKKGIGLPDLTNVYLPISVSCMVMPEKHAKMFS